VQIVQQPVAVEEIHGTADRNDHYVRHEDASLLIHLDLGQRAFPFCASGGVLQPHDGVQHAALRAQHQVLRVLFLSADVLVDRDGYLGALGRRAGIDHRTANIGRMRRPDRGEADDNADSHSCHAGHLSNNHERTLSV
jgi:hypothetical protein